MTKNAKKQPVFRFRIFPFLYLEVSKKKSSNSQAIHDSSEDKLETKIPVDGSEIRLTNQLRLVVYLPLFTRVLYISRCSFGISEASTVSSRNMAFSSNPGAFKSGFTIRCTCFTGAFRPRGLWDPPKEA